MSGSAHRLGRWLAAGAITIGLGIVWLLVATRMDLRPLPASFSSLTRTARATQFLDRRGLPLNVTLENHWNVHDIVPLHEIPRFLREAFVHAEDKRFYSQGGADWLARLSALATNLRYGDTVRGASTISEQVVRMLNPRPRTIWTRWLEGFEAARLEQLHSKDAILEFYLNQVPYASNRRGVRQAATLYFARDLDTLSRREMATLAVLVRSPSRLDPRRSLEASEGAVMRLVDAMQSRGALEAAEREAILAERLTLEAPHLPVIAPHFVRHIEAELERVPAPRTVTTLDGGLQREIQRLLDRRIASLAGLHVEHGAVLVVDNAGREVRAWVVAGGGRPEGPASEIDAVTTPRQPGSALKPFLYALALDRGWTAAEVIDDAPLAEDVGAGLHAYQNYSRRFYGPVTLRDALGNSLNIPALRTLHFTGAEAYLARLNALGFRSLVEHPDFYGDGVALGNGAVTLFELVQAYTALANRGVFTPLTARPRDDGTLPTRTVFSAEAASLIADILSDPDARALEFGRDSVHDLPVQTAIKTGTSSDYRDAWAVGFDTEHTVGIWMGNLDQEPTRGVTGSTGPALLLRSIFAELRRNTRPQRLYLSPRLARRRVCVPSPAALLERCAEREEWFVPGTEPAATAVALPRSAPRLRQPTPGLRVAIDPRLPGTAQVLEFAIDGLAPGDRVRWAVDGEIHWAGGAQGYLWPVARGRHYAQASVFRNEETIADLPAAEFTVR